MIDYYFCEQCETYHSPNRLVDGEYLTACECKVLNPLSPQDRQTPTKNTNNQGVQSSIPISYKMRQQQQHQQGQHHQERHKQININSNKQSGKYVNLPFMSIMNEENRKMKAQFSNENVGSRQSIRISHSNQISQQNSIKATSPMSVSSGKALSPRIAKVITTRQQANKNSVETQKFSRFSGFHQPQPPKIVISPPTPIRLASQQTEQGVRETEKTIISPILKQYSHQSVNRVDSSGNIVVNAAKYDSYSQYMNKGWKSSKQSIDFQAEEGKGGCCSCDYKCCYF